MNYQQGDLLGMLGGIDLSHQHLGSEGTGVGWWESGTQGHLQLCHPGPHTVPLVPDEPDEPEVKKRC